MSIIWTLSVMLMKVMISIVTVDMEINIGCKLSNMISYEEKCVLFSVEDNQ